MMREPPAAGVPVELEPGIRRVLGPNPSPMTYWGTNSYVLGTHEVVVIDPGPDDSSHLAALMGAIGGATVRAIVVTHAHRDHSHLAPELARRTGAEIMAFGPPRTGRSATMTRLAEQGLAGGGEGVDDAFRPERCLADGDRLSTEIGELTVLHTPGHFSGHLSLALDDAVFTGDHVMGWASTLISPPDGDLAAFMQSCHRLEARGDRVFYPGHGAPVSDPAGRLEWLVDHRRSREAQILAALVGPPATADELARRIYTDTAPGLLPAAARNVLAHLIDLHERKQVVATPRLSATARFARA